jgi:hypothetical protein
MAARPGNDSRKFAHGVRCSHPFKWGRGEVVAGLVLRCHGPEEPESLGVLGEEQSSFRHGPGEPESLGGTWEGTKIANSFSGEPESPGILEE